MLGNCHHYPSLELSHDPKRNGTGPWERQLESSVATELLVTCPSTVLPSLGRKVMSTVFFPSANSSDTGNRR